MRKIPRAKGYVRGLQNSGEYDIHPFDMDESPDGVYIEELGRSALPTTAVALEDVQGMYDEGVAVYPSDVAVLGQPFRIAHGVLGYTNGVYLHPTDYYWFRYEPTKAHKMCEGWLDRRLTHMADEAIAKLDRMYAEPTMSDRLSNIALHMRQTAAHLDRIGIAAKDLTDTLNSLYPEHPMLVENEITLLALRKKLEAFDPGPAFYYYKYSSASWWQKFKDWIMGR